jgi:uncharacterized protein YgiM (DUF1202 family)
MGIAAFAVRTSIYASVAIGAALFLVPIGALAVSILPSLSPAQPARVSIARDFDPAPTEAAVSGFGGTPAATAPQPEEPEEALGEPYSVISGVNVRSAPGKASSVVTTLQEGETVGVLEADGAWLKVARGQDVLGWVYDRYLSKVN